MVGLKNARSIQDEKLIEAIFNSHSHHTSTANMSNASYILHSPLTTTTTATSAASPSSSASANGGAGTGAVFGATSSNIIIDARPTTNAMANVAKGAGTENMEYYRNCKKAYLGIDNIHVMRDSLARIIEATQTGEETNRELLRKSGWLRHLSNILEGILIIVRAIHLANSHVLIHCSDGWDRTSQLSALSQMCLDPYYRTFEGFAVLIEKDWMSFGHRFGDRCGHTVPQRVQCVSGTNVDEDDEEVDGGRGGGGGGGFLSSMQQRLNFHGSSHAFKETCPVFDQFLDTVHQLQRQFPSRFEFDEAYLLELQTQLYECRYGNFLYNSEKERAEADVQGKTRSMWEVLLSQEAKERYRNREFEEGDREVLFPDPKRVRWWTGWFKREDMNDNLPLPGVTGGNSSTNGQSVSPAEPTFVESKQEDPVLRSIVPDRATTHIPTTTTDLAVDPLSSSSSTSSSSATLDNGQVSQGSTAVQGAMRSAWSAWRSVKQGYDNAVKDLTAEQSSTPSTGPSSASTAHSQTQQHTRMPGPYSAATSRNGSQTPPTSSFDALQVSSTGTGSSGSSKTQYPLPYVPYTRSSSSQTKQQRYNQDLESNPWSVTPTAASSGLESDSKDEGLSKGMGLAKAASGASYSSDAGAKSGNKSGPSTAADEDPLGVKVWS